MGGDMGKPEAFDTVGGRVKWHGFEEQKTENKPKQDKSPRLGLPPEPQVTPG